MSTGTDPMRKLIFVMLAMTIGSLSSVIVAQDTDSQDTTSAINSQGIDIERVSTRYLAGYHPDHRLRGSPIWLPRLGRYYTHPKRNSAAAFVGVLPDNCETIYSEDRTLYECNDILYRKTYLRGVIVYEIITDLDDLR